MNQMSTEHAAANDEAVSQFRNAFVACSETVRRVVVETVARHRFELIDRFYGRLSEDGEAEKYLPAPDRRERLVLVLADWLLHLFSAETEAEIGSVVAHQKQIGEVHARIGLPPQLMVRGMSHLRSRLVRGLAETELDRAQLLEAAEWVGSALDVSRAVMISAFVGSSERAARIDEAYRIFALGQNLQMERERQRAWLMEWSHAVLLALHRPAPRNLPSLESSEFGRWFRHKGMAMLEGAPEIPLIDDCIHRIDEQIVPRLATLRLGADDLESSAPTHRLDEEIATVKFHLATAFEVHIEVENGRDPLTRLLSRRFAPIVLGREIALARAERARGFAVALVDLDAFKQINDRHGHDAGDVVLQYVATVISNELRAGDFAFRWGGEEFLICLTDIAASEVGRVLDALRRRIGGTVVPLPDGGSISVSASIGVSIYDGHPDYQRMISIADAALYVAKSNGRDRVEIG